jgi:hypothetical protein
VSTTSAMCAFSCVGHSDGVVRDVEAAKLGTELTSPQRPLELRTVFAVPDAAMTPFLYRLPQIACWT